MLIDQEMSKLEDNNDNRTEVSDKESAANDRESLYSYGRMIMSSNYQYLLTYFKNAPTNQLSSVVSIRHGNLLSQTKISVKRVMEEAATKKFIYFNNSTVNALCVAIDNCLLDGLQRRTISLFEESHSMGLLKKISKDCDQAAYILTKVGNFSDHSARIVNGRFFQENESTKKSPNSISFPNTITGFFSKSKPSYMKYLWIKLAMVEKKLIGIIEHIMQRHQYYYDEQSIMSSCLSGSLFLELIAGPCSLDFSLVKPSEHIYNDPDASELLDRHLIHSVNSWPTVAGKNIYRTKIHPTRSLKSRPFLKIQHHVSPLQMQESKLSKDMAGFFNVNPSLSGSTTTNGNNIVAKEYVESLHQNLKHVLLYGKNSVIVQPKEDLGEMQGYLSLHLIAGDRLRLNWTPNQLMSYQVPQEGNGLTEEDGAVSKVTRTSHHSGAASLHSSLLQWDSALCIKIENIVYLHCHNHEEKGGTMTLVCQDGVQHPPFHFPPGGHLLHFITCLENGLMPLGHLEPPLIQINNEKAFPKRHRKHSNDSSLQSDGSEQSKPNRSLANSFMNTLNRSIRRRKDVQNNEDHQYCAETDDSDNCINCDFVFKIVYSNKIRSENSSCGSSYEEPLSAADTTKDNHLKFIWHSKDSSKDSSDNSSSIDTLCLAMRQQILSRAFYGWLQYYRNIRTIKTKFNNLVQPGSVQSDVPSDASEGLTIDVWNQYKTSMELDEKEIYRLIYFGGCSESIRREVWPRMLGHYSWSNFDTGDIDSRTEVEYERSLSQWKALEVIVRLREVDNVTGGVDFVDDSKVSQSIDKDEPLQIRNNDLSPSRGFYSSDTSTDTAILPVDDHDLSFKEDDLTCMADNMHRIDKDVDRCDRNHPYFSSHGVNRIKGIRNLKKLRNIMMTWVWEHVDIGYVQGMCDLLAPLLVVLDNESLSHACFTRLMGTMIFNFPQIGSRMDDNLSMMALLLQIIDRDLYDHMCADGEVTSLYVSYRWFLLDFKRELCYADVFSVWETIWSARNVASDHFNLFLALSLLQYYRDIILDNGMEYTDIIKFYNEMAEKHQVRKLLYIARGLIESIRDILETSQ